MEKIQAMKDRLYPERKATMRKYAMCYRDKLLSMADMADKDELEMVMIPIGMAYHFVEMCNFIERY